MYQMMYIGITC